MSSHPVQTVPSWVQLETSSASEPSLGKLIAIFPEKTFSLILLNSAKLISIHSSEIGLNGK